MVDANCQRMIFMILLVWISECGVKNDVAILCYIIPPFYYSLSYAHNLLGPHKLNNVYITYLIWQFIIASTQHQSVFPIKHVLHLTIDCTKKGHGMKPLRGIKTHETPSDADQYVNLSRRKFLLIAVKTFVNRSARFFSVPCFAILIVPAATASRQR